MNNWQKSLDRYLTQEPPDDSWWFEKCSDLIKISEELWNKYEQRVEIWMEFFFNRERTPEYAAKIIEALIIKKELNEYHSEPVS